MSAFPRWLTVCALVAQAGCGSFQWSSVFADPAEPKAAQAPAPKPAVKPAPIKLPPHPVIEAYVAGLQGILSEQEKATLSAISLDGTYVGDPQRLRYLAADRAVRVFLPESLEATRNPELIEHARKIRALPPLMNPDTDAVAYDVVSEALRARQRIEDEKMGLRPKAAPGDAASAAPVTADLTDVLVADPAAAPPTDGSAVSAIHDVDAEARAQYAEAVAAYAEAYAAVFGADKLHADSAATAAADASDAAELLTEAIARGADRELMVQVGISLVQQMADAARRRERVPLPKITPPKKPVEP